MEAPTSTVPTVPNRPEALGFPGFPKKKTVPKPFQNRSATAPNRSVSHGGRPGRHSGCPCAPLRTPAAPHARPH